MATIPAVNEQTVSALKEYLSNFDYAQSPVPIQRKYTRYNKDKFRIRPEYRQLANSGRQEQPPLGLGLVVDTVVKNKPEEVKNEPVRERPVVIPVLKNGVSGILPEEKMNTYELKNPVSRSLTEDTQNKTVEMAKKKGMEVKYVGGRLVISTLVIR
jgi:hypothetical protein